MRQRIAVSTLVAVATMSSVAGAQIGRRATRSADPGYWVGLSYGYVDGTNISDDATSSVWRFGYTSQIRATLEKTIQSGVAIGASAGFATAPLDYYGSSSGTVCTTRCAAKADVTQWLATLRAGGSSGFHGMYSVEAGVTQFSHFRERATGAALPPSGSTSDFTFGFGGGFGYNFSPITEAYVGEQFQFVLHRQGDNASQSAPRMLTFRVGFRMGF